MKHQPKNGSAKQRSKHPRLHGLRAPQRAEVPEMIGMRVDGGNLPEANRYTLLALQNAFMALNEGVRLLSEVSKKRPEESDAGSVEQAYHLGRVHMAEEATNVLDAIRSQVLLTSNYGAPKYEVKG